MPCNIHPYAEAVDPTTKKWLVVRHDVFPLTQWEVQTSGKTHTNRPFKWRNYNMFGFLANVKNLSVCEFLSQGRGCPTDSPTVLRPSDPQYEGFHSHTYVTLKELLDFDYDKVFEDRRAANSTVEEGKGKKVRYREFLGDHFFEHLTALKELGFPENVRIVLWFDGE